MSSTVLGRVLVVDDEFSLMDALVEALNACGYEAHGFPTGVEAIQALQKQAYDLLLTDLMMPGMDGITLLKACLAIDQNLVGIIMTGQGTVPTAVEAMKSGAFDYVLKPFRLDSLLPVLARAREMQQLRLENIQLRETVAIYNLSQTIAFSLESRLVLEHTADAALKQTDADEVSIMLLQPGNQALYIAAVRGRDREHLLGQHISVQEGIAGWVARHVEPVILNGQVSDPRFASLSPRAEIRSAISMPMLSGGKLVGVLNINSLQPRRPFTPGQVKALSILTNTAAGALQNQALYDALQAREKRFRALIENAPDGITVVDQKGTVIYVSPSVKRLLGYSQDEALGQPATKYVHPEDRSQLLQQLSQLPGEHGQALVQYRFRHRDGSWRWLESTVSNLISEPGIEGVVFNYRDITERKQAEGAVLESERQMTALVTSLDDIVFEFDEQGTYLNVWASDESKLTQPKGQLLGKRIDEVLGEENGRPFTEAVKRALASGRSEVVEYPLSVLGGERWFTARISPIATEDESRQSVSMLVRDITERRRAEEALRESEIRFRSLIENSSDEISIISAEGELMYESPTTNPTLGYQPGEFLGRNLFQLIHPDDLARVQEQFARLIQDPDSHPRDQFRLRHQNGDWRWVEAVGTNLLSEPSVRGIVINYHDITERKRAAEKIERQLQRLNALRAIDMAISSSFDIHVTLDIVLQHVISQVGVHAAAVLLVQPDTQTIEYAAGRGFRSTAIRQSRFRAGEGYAGQAILERRMIHIPDLTQTDGKFVRAILLKGEDFMGYYCVPLIVKGEVKGVLEIFHRSPLHPNSESLDFLETLAGQAAIALDNAQLFENLQRANTELEGRVAERTAELNRTNIELEHANRAKDEFLANMSHELRTPLNSILGLSESLLEQHRGPLNDHQQKSLQTIEASGQHLLELINDILDLSKIEAGMFDIFPQPIALDDLCRACLAFVRAQAARKSITLNQSLDPAVSEILADPRRLKQMLVNLLTNAVKFTPEGGQVTLQVRANPEQDRIRLSVIDTGIGIATEDLPKLFQPFVQVDSSLNRQFEGTGLGLALVQKLADLHGGSVDVESEVGEGSRFTINLPWKKDGGPASTLLSSEPAYASESSAEGPAGRGVILLAEDNKSNILTVGDYLESHGYTVVVAHDGWEALAKADELNPNIILMDIQMPGMDGLEATRRLRANPRFAATPIIALTALAMPGDRERCLEAGATAYMSKPVSLKTLRQTIESSLPTQPGG